LREERLVRSVHSLDAIAAPLPRVDLRVDASLLLVSVASEALLDGARVVLADVLDRSFGLGLLVCREHRGVLSRLPSWVVDFIT
jgi:hypothetical protein